MRDDVVRIARRARASHSSTVTCRLYIYNTAEQHAKSSKIKMCSKQLALGKRSFVRL